MIVSDNPIETSEDFYKTISCGGKESQLSNGKGVQTVFEDGTRIVYRVITSTPDSPAVDITVNIESPVKKQKSISSERTNTMVQAKFTSEMIDCLRKLIGESFVSYDGAIMNQTAYGNLQLNTEHFSVELRNEVHPFSLFSEVEDVSCFSCIFKERVLYSNRFVRNRGKQYQLMKNNRSLHCQRYCHCKR